jgi:hypothetical protein
MSKRQRGGSGATALGLVANAAGPRATDDGTAAGARTPPAGKVGDHRPRPWAKWEYLLVAALLFTALGLRVYRLDARGFWFDEHWTMMVSSGRGLSYLEVPKGIVLNTAPDPTASVPGVPWYRAWTNTAFDVHPPLYAVLVRGWRAWVGESDVAIRGLSVVASVVAVGLTYTVGRRAIGPVAGAWAAALMAVGPHQVYYAQHARSYAFTMALTLAVAWATLRLLEEGPTWPRRVALGGLAAAALLTHYFAAGIVVALAFYAWWSGASDGRRRSVVLWIGAGIGLFAVVWVIPFATHQRMSAGGVGGWLDDPNPGHLWRVAGWFLAAPLKLLAVPFRNPVAADALFTLTVLALPLAYVRRNRGLLLAYLAVVLCLAQPLVVDIGKGTAMLSLVRYIILAMPFLCLVLGGLGAVVGGRLRHVVPAVALAYCVFQIPQGYVKQFAEWRAVAAPIVAAGGTAPVVLAGLADFERADSIDVRYLYMCLRRYLPADRPVVLLDGRADESVRGFLRGQGRFWLVSVIGAPLEAYLPSARPVDPRRVSLEELMAVTQEYTFQPPATTAPAGL